MLFLFMEKYNPSITGFLLYDYNSCLIRTAATMTLETTGFLFNFWQAIERKTSKINNGWRQDGLGEAAWLDEKNMGNKRPRFGIYPCLLAKVVI